MKAIIFTFSILLVAESSVVFAQTTGQPGEPSLGQPADPTGGGGSATQAVSGPTMSMTLGGLEFPDCPKELVGQFGGMYHYVTETCPANGDEAFSQSTSNLTLVQCGVSVPDVCGDGPALPGLRITANNIAEAKTLVNDGLTDLASFKAKYPNIKGKRKSYIEGLEDYRNEWKTRLDNGGTLADFNKDYDSSGNILAADEDARATWGRFGPSGGDSPWAPVLSDEKVQKDGTLETVQAGWTVATAFYLEVTSGSDTVFFRWLDLKKGDKHSYVAFQVDRIPAGEAKTTATFTQKNNYTHLLTRQGSSTPFFATTFDDLTP